MNYIAHYKQLIDRAKSRQVIGYCEQHHIVPKCMGGTNEKENLVKLTPEEHYVAHLLLMKMHPDSFGLVWASVCMSSKANNNKIYKWLRIKYSNGMKTKATGRVMSMEARQKMSDAKRGKKRGPHSLETRAKMSAAAKGVPKSAEHRNALSKAKIGTRGNHRVEHSAIQRINISLGRRRQFANLPKFQQLTGDQHGRI